MDGLRIVIADCIVAMVQKPDGSRAAHRKFAAGNPDHAGRRVRGRGGGVGNGRLERRNFGGDGVGVVRCERREMAPATKRMVPSNVKMVGNDLVINSRHGQFAGDFRQGNILWPRLGNQTLRVGKFFADALAKAPAHGWPLPPPAP